MLKQVETKAGVSGLKNIKFICQDVQDITLDSGSLTCGYGMYFFEEMERNLSNPYKFLASDGMMVFSTFTADAYQPFADLLLEYLQSYGVIEK